MVDPKLFTVAMFPLIEMTFVALLEKDTGSFAEDVAVSLNVFLGIFGILVAVAKVMVGVPFTIEKLVVTSGAGM